MSYDFNANDILEMAEQIERNGAVFYKTAAEIIDDATEKAFLLELAAMEEDHEKTFTGIKSGLSDKEKELPVFDPDGENSMYLRSLADTRVFFEKQLPDSSYTMADILSDAITAEKDSIVFYLGMKGFVPKGLGKDRIDAIIEEEMKHIRLLSQKLSECKKES